MIKRPEVVNMLLSSTWRILLDQKSILRELKNFCAICGQWFSEEGPGLKTHYRRMHDEAWSRKSDAIARCAQAGLSKTSPCAYCGACFRTPGAHNKSCNVLLQASILGLLICQDHGGSVYQSTTANAETDAILAALERTKKDKMRQESESDQANQAKYHRGSSRGTQGQQGKGQRGWTDSKDSWSSCQNKDWQKGSTQKEEIEELKEMVKILTKLALKHEDESSRLRSETGFMLYLHTDSKGITADLLEVSSKW